MKTKLSTKKIRLFILFLALYPAPLALCQIPQGFNYQAIARDVSGNILANQLLPVKIDIMDALTGGNLIYEESFSSITSNQFGLITLVVGKGEPLTGIFSAIDWKSKTLYLRTKIEYPSGTWIEMGTSQIWSVPYSLVAKDVDGPIAKLGITGTTDNMEEALFEVKNKAGNTVFAVYNEGIRAYVGNGDAKGVRGGFSVGGYDATKGSTIYDLFTLSTDSARLYFDSKPTLKGKRGGFAVGGYDMTKGGIAVQNYLDISKDSVRIYIDSNPLTKGKKGGFAVGGYDMTKGLSTNYMNVNTDESGIINPSENRILWYPLKNAFFTGKVLIEKADSVGENSFASGFESKAIGNYSQALGYKSVAKGAYSSAFGKNARVKSNYSYAFGEDVVASSDYSYSFGRSTIASGDGSFAFGYKANAQGQDSYAFGTGSQATGIGSFALGFIGRDTAGSATGNTKASGNYSFAIGMGAQALSQGAFALGTQSMAGGQFSLSAGYSTTASGDLSVALGDHTRATGGISTAFGYNTKASGSYSTVFGYESQATSHCATAFGLRTKATEWYTTALGSYTLASGYCSLSTGSSTVASGMGSFSSGGSTVASGAYSVAMGFYTKAKPFGTVVIGQYNDTTFCLSPYNFSGVDPIFICGNGITETNRSNSFMILQNGATAIGNFFPTQMLDVDGNARFRSVGSGGFSYNLNITSDGTLTTSTSDVRMKDDIIEISNALDKVMKLRGVDFTWKSDPHKTLQMGMIAQEVEKVVPEIVFTNPVDGLKGINYSQSVSLLVEAIKEQQNQIEFQKQENQELKSELQTMKERLDRMEGMMAGK
jgi:hypothetical protein